LRPLLQERGAFAGGLEVSHGRSVSMYIDTKREKKKRLPGAILPRNFLVLHPLPHEFAGETEGFGTAAKPVRAGARCRCSPRNMVRRW
jgi:hypothetical protein